MLGKYFATLALLLISATSSGAKPISIGNPEINHLTTIRSTTNFCLFLPPKPGMEIGSHEHDAIVFCTQPNPVAPKAKMLPKNFIKTAHFKKTPDWVQITGRMNPSAYGLSRKDGGGQYDNRGAPAESGCAGYTFFVSLIEPDTGKYCIRCCNQKNDCNMGLSTQGCSVVIPGVY